MAAMERLSVLHPSSKVQIPIVTRYTNGIDVDEVLTHTKSL
jgi:hypothetical protein